MKKSIKKITSLITLALVTSTLVGGQAINAETTTSTSTAAVGGKYGTNPESSVGKEAKITIDGSYSDWTEDMIIAKGLANDSPVKFKGDWENCVVDSYALYGAWDDENIYLAWQNVNTADVTNGQGAAVSDGKLGPLAMIIALDTGKGNAMTGRTDGVAPKNKLWDSLDVTFSTRVDHILAFSANGTGTPGFFTGDANGLTNYKANCGSFKTLGIEYKFSDGCFPKQLMGVKNIPGTPEGVEMLYDNSVEATDLMTGHDTKLDTFYEMKIPLSALGITKDDLTKNGVGVMQLSTRGESPLDCLPHDPCMLDNVFGDYAAEPSNTHEKDDNDNITVPLASLGKLRDASVVPEVPDTPTKKNPAISKFEADKETIKKDEEVKFTCTATDATSYEFKINDKAVDAEEVSKNVLTHTFTEDGDYVVEVTAKGGTGTTAATKKFEFKIGAQEPQDPENPEELKITSFEATNTDEEIETGTKVDFSAEATGADDIKYSFTVAKDGEDAEKLTLNKDGESTTWTPEEEGTYVIEMTASAEGLDAVTQKKEYKVKAKGTDVPADKSIEDIELNTKSNLTVNADDIVRFTTKVEGGQGTLQYLFTVDGIDQGKYSSKAIFDFKSDVAGKHIITVKVKDETGESLESAPKVVKVLENEQTETPGDEVPGDEVPTADASSMLPVAIVMMIAFVSLVRIKKRKQS